VVQVLYGTLILGDGDGRILSTGMLLQYDDVPAVCTTTTTTTVTGTTV
jgi:hypothetical protein